MAWGTASRGWTPGHVLACARAVRVRGICGNPNFDDNPVATFFGGRAAAWLSIATCSPESLKNSARSSARKSTATRPASVIRGPVVTADAGHGDSIPVNGVCLTVVEVLPDGAFSADVMDETLNRSSLRGVAVGSRVNLERAAAVDSRLGPTRPGTRGRRRSCGRADTVRTLGSRADRPADSAVPVCRREGFDHR